MKNIFFHFWRAFSCTKLSQTQKWTFKTSSTLQLTFNKMRFPKGKQISSSSSLIITFEMITDTRQSSHMQKCIVFVSGRKKTREKGWFTLFSCCELFVSVKEKPWYKTPIDLCCKPTSYFIKNINHISTVYWCSKRAFLSKICSSFQIGSF